MFDILTSALTGIFSKLRKRGILSITDIDNAMIAIKAALLDADVALIAAKNLIENIREKAVGAKVLKSVKPGEMVVKIVYDELVRMLGGNIGGEEQEGDVASKEASSTMNMSEAVGGIASTIGKVMTGSAGGDKSVVGGIMGGLAGGISGINNFLQNTPSYGKMSIQQIANAFKSDNKKKAASGVKNQTNKKNRNGKKNCMHHDDKKNDERHHDSHITHCESEVDKHDEIRIQEILDLECKSPAIIMIIGLQGSGKTTTTGKIAKKLKCEKRKILMASTDIYRPAAQLQLAKLGSQINVDTLPIIDGDSPEKITSRAIDVAKLQHYDVLLIDTAGRLQIDEQLMLELQHIKKISSPIEVLLVSDAMLGQEAANVAKEFNDKIGITGIVLTRVDGDARGGAALSMSFVTGCRVKLVGIGEKITDIDRFDPSRTASRILGMGDVVSLVEKAAEHVGAKEAEDALNKMQKGAFDLDDLMKQMLAVKKMGDLGSIVGMIPGFGKLKDKLKNSGNLIDKQVAIIRSMTKLERKNPKIINGPRKRRIAVGSGSSVEDVNALLNQYKNMMTLMKGQGGGSMLSGGLMGNLAKMFG